MTEVALGCLVVIGFWIIRVLRQILERLRQLPAIGRPTVDVGDGRFAAPEIRGDDRDMFDPE